MRNLQPTKPVLGWRDRLAILKSGAGQSVEEWYAEGVAQHLRELTLPRVRCPHCKAIRKLTGTCSICEKLICDTCKGEDNQ